MRFRSLKERANRRGVSVSTEKRLPGIYPEQYGTIVAISPGRKGVPDNEDPDPTVPGVPSSFLEDEAREVAVEIRAVDLSGFSGPNSNANRGRRNSLANRADNAAKAIAAGDIQGAIDELMSLLARIDGQSPPPDWMDDSPEKTALADEVSLLILLLEFL